MAVPASEPEALNRITAAVESSVPPLGGGGGQLMQPIVPKQFGPYAPTIDTAAYVSGDSLFTAVGSIPNMAAANGGTFLLDFVKVLDKSAPSGVANPSAIDVLFFNQTMTPSAANAPSAISDADMANCIGRASVGSYSTGTVNSYGEATGVNEVLSLAGVAATTVFWCAIVRGTPTYGTAGDLLFTFGGYQLS